jgi:hypothetical protein
MTGLQQLMHDALDQHPTDVVQLAARARTRGTTLRRRHRLATVGSSLAAVVLVIGAATGGSALFGHGSQVAGSHVVAGAGNGQSLTRVNAVLGAVARANGSKVQVDWSESSVPSATQAASDLKHAVSALPIGGGPTVRGLRAAATTGHPAMVGADLSLGSVLRPVGRVLMTTESAAGYGRLARMKSHIEHCGASLAHCRVFRLLNGARVRTYTLSAGSVGGTAEINVAEQLRGGVVTSLVSYGPRVHPPSAVSPGALSTSQLVDVLSKLDHLS